MVTVVPGDDTTVSAASYVLRKSGMTHEMTFRELFERILGQGKWQPLIDANERYYMFGGKAPKGLLEALPWPSDLKFVGSSPYVASEGVTAKAHYDHWYAFLVQLHGTKAVKLFPPWDYSFIYPQHEKRASAPRRALVDLNNPDFEQFPLLKQLHGEIAVLNAAQVNANSRHHSFMRSSYTALRLFWKLPSGSLPLRSRSGPVQRYSCVRRQIIWDFWRRDRVEDLAHLLIDAMRLGRGVASVWSGWSVV